MIYAIALSARRVSLHFGTDTALVKEIVDMCKEWVTDQTTYMYTNTFSCSVVSRYLILSDGCRTPINIKNYCKDDTSTG